MTILNTVRMTLDVLMGTTTNCAFHSLNHHLVLIILQFRLLLAIRLKGTAHTHPNGLISMLIAFVGYLQRVLLGLLICVCLDKLPVGLSVPCIYFLRLNSVLLHWCHIAVFMILCLLLINSLIKYHIRLILTQHISIFSTHIRRLDGPHSWLNCHKLSVV